MYFVAIVNAIILLYTHRRRPKVNDGVMVAADALRQIGTWSPFRYQDYHHEDKTVVMRLVMGITTLVSRSRDKGKGVGNSAVLFLAFGLSRHIINEYCNITCRYLLKW